MTAELAPPPEAQLITRLREKPPLKSMRQAALEAAISPTHWRQIETGIRRFRGRDYPETGTARTLAKMALVVGATPGDLSGAGRDDAAAELEAILDAIDANIHRPELSPRQRKAIADRMLRDASGER